MEDLVLDSNDLIVVVSVGIVCICFCMYWFTVHAEGLKRQVDKRYREGHFEQFGALYQKSIGFFCLGVIPFVIGFAFLPQTTTEIGLGKPAWKSSLYWVFLLGGGLFFIPRYSAKHEEMQSYYPQVRISEWSPHLLIVNGLFWTLYLVAYEFLYRGFLLLNLVAVMGWWPAVTITTAITTLSHIPKGSKETFGTIPFSLVLCLIVYQTGSIWPCVVVHAILAIANDYWAVYYHPNMKFTLSGLKQTGDRSPVGSFWGGSTEKQKNDEGRSI